MTLDEAIIHCEEVAKENNDSAKEFYRVSKLETHPDRKRAKDGYVECKKCADEHRQLAEWLRDYKELKSLATATKPKWKAEDRYVKNKFFMYPYCPKCGCEIVTGDCHCKICGQHIDWDEDDE